MDHLTGETLARLVDEPAEGPEREHLEGCDACRAELRAMREQTESLRSLPPLDPPPALLESIQRELLEEGLVDGRRRRGEGWGVPMRIAAAITLFLAGSATGVFLIAPAAGPGPVAVGEGSPEAADLVQAAASLRAAEADYVRAVTRYAELSNGGEAVDPLNRLVALEGIVVTTEAALREAPADPIINNFHLTAVGQRDALLRQLQLAGNGDEWF